jgi:hypothetical protein
VGGALALDAAWLFAAFLIILILAAAGIAVRRFLLERGGGTVECGLRNGSGPWRLGLASYQREELNWFGVFGVSMRPEETFPRRDLTVVSRRLPSDAEAARLGPGMIVVECQPGDDSAPSDASTVELAMGEAALTGFLAWLEAAPPGSYRGIVLLPTVCLDPLACWQRLCTLPAPA